MWKRDHSQHCFAHHFPEAEEAAPAAAAGTGGGCKRDRTCAFLHADVGVAEAVVYG